MPWAERAECLKTAYGVEVSDRTLKSWAAKLIDEGLLLKSGEKSYWRTYTDFHGNKKREWVEGIEELEAEMSRFFKDRAAKVKKYINEGLDKKTAYSRAFTEIYSEYGCCFYACKSLSFAAYCGKNEALQEIYELVDIING